MRGLVLWEIWYDTKWMFLQNNAAWIYCIIALNFIMANMVTSLQITSLIAPSTADPRFDSPEMTCRYEFGDEGLFTVKWYKDDREFYRYLPTFDPQIIRFPTEDISLSEDGFQVMETTLEKRLASPEICNTSACTIQLINLVPISAGTYSCEISSERPLYFKTEIKSINLTIFAPPINSPIIHCNSVSYAIGDSLSATCTSDSSIPTSEIYWMINGETVPSNNSVMFSSVNAQLDKMGLQRSMSQLDIELEEHHISNSHNGHLNITCISSLPNTNISISSQALFPLAEPQRIMDDNQKLEWNSSSGEKNINLFVSLSTAMLLIIFKLTQVLLCD